MTFVFDARDAAPAIPANDTDARPAPVLRLVEAPAPPARVSRSRRLLRKALRRAR